MLPTVDHVIGQMKNARFLSKLDANSGFHQIKFAEDSRKLTTFITPFKFYCYECLP